MAIARVTIVTRWLFLVHRVPPRPPYLRAKIRQRLEQAGALALKNSVYALPSGSETLEDLQWIAQEVVAGGGDAHLLEGDFVDAGARRRAVEAIRKARAEDYRAVTRAASAARRAAGASPERSRAAHARLTKRLEDVRRIDFFEVRERAAAETAVRSLADRDGPASGDAGKGNRMKDAVARHRGKTWVTRPGIKVDRIASAWFIRRFVDPKARFRFVDPGAPKRAGEVRFDMVGGDVTHEGDRCTFESLVRRFGLPDKGVRAIAEIVHDLDLKDGKFGRPEAEGVRSLLDGLIARHAKDAERLERGLAMFDDLHEALAARSEKRRTELRAPAKTTRRETDRSG